MALPQRSGAGLSLAYAAAGASVLGLAMIHELSIRQPALYTFGGFGASPGLSAATAMAGALAALLGAGRRVPLAGWLLGSSALSAASGALWFWAAGRAHAPWIVSCVVPAGAGLLAAGSFMAVRRELWPRVVELNGSTALLDPLRLLALLGAGLGAAALASSVGPLRAALLLGLAFGVLGGWWCLASGAGRRLVAGASGLVLLELGGLSAAQHVLPLGELRGYPNPVVYSRGAPPDRLIVTAGQDAVEVFVAGTLTWSSLDGYRYAEALAHPALSAAARRGRVLVIERGTGAIVREVLRWPDVGRVRVLAESKSSVELARSARWLSALTGGSASDPRVTSSVVEPAPWLEAHRETYDVIIADPADPVDHERAKHFTRYFFWLLASRLAPDGVLAVQAGAPRTSAATHAAISAALSATGLVVTPYAVGVPTLGEWGMLLGSRGPLRFEAALPEGLRYLRAGSVPALFAARAPHAAPSRPALLYDQVLLEN